MNPITAKMKKGTGEMRFGSGKFTYEVVEGWPRIPEGWDLVEVPAVGVDSQDRVYLFSRSEHPVVVFDREGHFLRSWGEGVFQRPHGIGIGPDDSLYCVDDFDHAVRKCTPEGEVLLLIGTPGRCSDTGVTPGDYLSVQRGGPPFNRPTSVALSPEGDIYVTDGYHNARVHKFSPEGRLLFSWGEPGTGPGQFHLVHGICVGPDGTVFAGDRMNSRVQVFSPRGEFITQWNDVYQPNELYMDPDGHIFIGEIGYRSNLPLSGPVPTPEDSYARVTVRNTKGEILAALRGPNPEILFDEAGGAAPRDESARRAALPGGLLSPHGVWVDSHGDLYVAEVSATRARTLGKDRHQFHMVQRFARVTA